MVEEMKMKAILTIPKKRLTKFDINILLRKMSKHR